MAKQKISRVTPPTKKTSSLVGSSAGTVSAGLSDKAAEYRDMIQGRATTPPGEDVLNKVLGTYVARVEEQLFAIVSRIENIEENVARNWLLHTITDLRHEQRQQLTIRDLQKEVEKLKKNSSSRG